MKTYRKKPIVIEAIQWNGNSNRQEIENFVGKELKAEIESETAYVAGKGAPIFSLLIETEEGVMRASKGDFIIKGIHGEFYPCKPDIFEKTYDQFQSKQSLTDVTDEEIEKIFSTDNFDSGDDDGSEQVNYDNGLRQDGAKWMRDKLQTKEPNEADPTDEQKEQFKKAMAKMDKNSFVVMPCYDVDLVKFARWLAMNYTTIDRLDTDVIVNEYKQSLIQERWKQK